MATGARSVKVLFPAGGVNRSAGYAQKEQPYTSPWAMNVRSTGPLEGRGRGGSRPGLSKVVDNDFGTNICGLAAIPYYDASSNLKHDIVVIADGSIYTVSGSTITQSKAYLKTEAGDYIITEDGNRIIFGNTISATNPLGDDNTFQLAEHYGKLLIADSSLTSYNPKTGETAVVSNAPTSQPLVSSYQARAVVAGESNIFYMSRVDNIEDWDFSDDMSDQARAVAGHIPGSTVGAQIKAICSYRDSAHVFATNDGLWALYGNPAGNGRMKQVSGYLGSVSPGGLLALPDGTLLILTRAGLYIWSFGSDAPPQPFSEQAVPDEFQDILSSNTTVKMAWDAKARGVHILLTPSYGNGTHWFLDSQTKALWPFQFPLAKQPSTLAIAPLSGYNVIMGCADGYVRKFDDDATDDDGTTMTSDLLLGPFHTSRMDGYDGMIAELEGSMAANSGSVTWSIITGDSAEAAVDAAVSMMSGSDEYAADDSGTWTAGRNDVEYPRSRGAWAVIRLTATAPWAYESIKMATRQLGRIRNG